MDFCDIVSHVTAVLEAFFFYLHLGALGLGVAGSRGWILFLALRRQIRMLKIMLRKMNHAVKVNSRDDLFPWEKNVSQKYELERKCELFILEFECDVNIFHHNVQS